MKPAPMAEPTSDAVDQVRRGIDYMRQTYSAEYEVRIWPPKSWHGAYYLTAYKGLRAFDSGWFVFGRKRAERKAQRILTRMRRADETARAAWTVRSSA